VDLAGGGNVSAAAAASLFVSSSPDQFCTPHRVHDDDALIHAIDTANSSVGIEVMDYLPTTLYITPPATNFYWGKVDDALRSAAYRGVRVRLMAARWNYTSPAMYQYLASLNQLTNLEVKIYQVPQIPNQQPYTRVNHAKFMVTDSVAYVGTSNWTPDYWLFTGGVGLSVSNQGLRQQLQNIFDRDWYSPFASWANNTNPQWGN